jgi:hypothetical protein
MSLTRLTVPAGLTCPDILAEPGAPEWAAINTGLTDLDVRVLAVDPINKTTLYAGGRSGVFKSVDGGAAWSTTGLITSTQTVTSFPGVAHLPNGFTAASIVVHLAIDSMNPNTLYAATIRSSGCVHTQRRIFKSTDGGATWTDGVSPNINGCDNIHSLVLAPSDPATLYLTNFDDATGDTWSPLVRTTDGAATWTYLGYPILNVLAVDPFDSRTVYAGTFDFEPSFTTLPNGVLKSSDGGVTWAATGLTGTGISALTLDPGNPRTLYAATAAGYIYKSADGGTSWAAVNNGLTASTVAALVVDPGDSNIVYVAMSGGGVWRSVNAGATWTPFNDGLQSLDIRSLALVAGKPSTLYAGTPSGVFKR